MKRTQPRFLYVRVVVDTPEGVRVVDFRRVESVVGSSPDPTQVGRRWDVGRTLRTHPGQEPTSGTVRETVGGRVGVVGPGVPTSGNVL